MTAVPGELFLVSFPLNALLVLESLALSLRSDFNCPSLESGKNYSIYTIYGTLSCLTILIYDHIVINLLDIQFFFKPKTINMNEIVS